MSVSTFNTPTGFDRFGLHQNLTRGIHAAGFENPRPIQLETIPAGLDGRDVLGLAQTGTGKTAAFALPILNHFLEKPDKSSCPNNCSDAGTGHSDRGRDPDAFQVHRNDDDYRLRRRLDAKPDQALRKRPEIVVGCPGRVLDLMRQGVLRLDQVQTLVLDEADHMFDMGFLPDIRKILGKLPKNRQNLLFSATMPKEIRGLAVTLLSDPHIVELANAAPVSTVDHALYLISESRKRDLPRAGAWP